MDKFLLSMLPILFVGCSILDTIGAVFDVPEPKQRLRVNEVNYRRDMVVNGAVGVLVLPHTAIQSQMTFHVEAMGDLDLFTITTCHRSWSKEAAWNITQIVKGGWWESDRKIVKKREVKFTLNLDKELEMDGDCPLELAGYSKEGVHSWAFIDFEHPRYALTADIRCNGQPQIAAPGVAICQAREGLVQKIEFDVEVILSPDGQCSVGAEKGSVFEFPMPSGDCVFLFRETKSPHREFKLTTLGYQSILIRQ